MNKDKIKEQLGSLQEKFKAEVKRAADLEEENKQLKEQLEQKNAEETEQKTASDEELSSVRELANQLASGGFLAEDKKAAFVDSVIENPFGLIGVARKVANFREQAALLDLGTASGEVESKEASDGGEKRLDKFEEAALARRSRRS